MRRTDEPNAQTQHATILGGSWHQGDFVAWFTLQKLHLNAKLCPRVHRTSSLGLGNLSREQRKFPQVQLRNNFRRCLMSKPVTSQPSWPLKPLRSSKNTAKGQSAPHRAEAGTGHKLDGFFLFFVFFLTLQQVWEDWGKHANHCENAFRQFSIPVLRLKLRDISFIYLFGSVFKGLVCFFETVSPSSPLSLKDWGRLRPRDTNIYMRNKQVWDFFLLPGILQMPEVL